MDSDFEQDGTNLETINEIDKSLDYIEERKKGEDVKEEAENNL